MPGDGRDSGPAGTVISVKDLRVQYGEQEILHGLNFDVARSETLVILGGSGSGKSTLLRTLVGLEKPSAGQIWMKGQGQVAVPQPMGVLGLAALTVPRSHRRGPAHLPKAHRSA